MAEEESRDPLAGGRRIAEVLLEAEAAARNQVVADVMAAVVLRIGWRAPRAPAPPRARATSGSGFFAPRASCSTEWR